MWIADARSRGLDYDAECFKQILERWLHTSSPAVECEPELADHFDWIICEKECQIYFGTALVGEPCELVGRRMSTCAADLACGVDGRCHEPCDIPLDIPAGEPCGQTLGLATEGCGGSLICSADPGICVEPLALGMSCESMDRACGPGAYCSSDAFVCAAASSQGSPCAEHDQCASGVCDEVCIRPDSYECANHSF